MTLPVVPPGPLSMSQINTEIQQSSTALISLNDTTVRTVAGVTTPGSQISFTNFSGKAYTVAGNSGILTSGSSYTLPATSGLTSGISYSYSIRLIIKKLTCKLNMLALFLAHNSKKNTCNKRDSCRKCI